MIGQGGSNKNNYKNAVAAGPARAITGGDQGVYTHFGKQVVNKKEILISTVGGAS